MENNKTISGSPSLLAAGCIYNYVNCYSKENAFTFFGTALHYLTGLWDLNPARDFDSLYEAMELKYQGQEFPVPSRNDSRAHFIAYRDSWIGQAIERDPMALLFGEEEVDESWASETWKTHEKSGRIIAHYDLGDGIFLRGVQDKIFEKNSFKGDRLELHAGDLKTGAAEPGPIQAKANALMGLKMFPEYGGPGALIHSHYIFSAKNGKITSYSWTPEQLRKWEKNFVKPRIEYAKLTPPQDLERTLNKYCRYCPEVGTCPVSKECRIETPHKFIEEIRNDDQFTESIKALDYLDIHSKIFDDLKGKIEINLMDYLRPLENGVEGIEEIFSLVKKASKHSYSFDGTKITLEDFGLNPLQFMTFRGSELPVDKIAPVWNFFLDLELEPKDFFQFENKNIERAIKSLGRDKAAMENRKRLKSKLSEYKISSEYDSIKRKKTDVVEVEIIKPEEEPARVLEAEVVEPLAKTPDAVIIIAAPENIEEKTRITKRVYPVKKKEFTTVFGRQGYLVFVHRVIGEKVRDKDLNLEQMEKLIAEIDTMLAERVTPVQAGEKIIATEIENSKPYVEEQKEIEKLAAGEVLEVSGFGSGKVSQAKAEAVIISTPAGYTGVPPQVKTDDFGETLPGGIDAIIDEAKKVEPRQKGEGLRKGGPCPDCEFTLEIVKVNPFQFALECLSPVCDFTREL